MFLQRDRDTKFTAAFDAVLTASGIRILQSPVQAPRANAIMEPWIGSCRRELLDQTLIWNPRHLLGSVFDELREISHGIHPAILSKGGLTSALNALRRHAALPVELDLHAERRLPEPVEVAAYTWCQKR
jgi:signal transduction histidine kinase